MNQYDERHIFENTFFSMLNFSNKKRKYLILDHLTCANQGNFYEKIAMTNCVSQL